MASRTAELAGRHGKTVGGLALAVWLAIAATAVALLAFGYVGAMGMVGEPPRPGWTLAPGPWPGAGVPSGGSAEQVQVKEEG